MKARSMEVSFDARAICNQSSHRLGTAIYTYVLPLSPTLSYLIASDVQDSDFAS